MGARDGVIAGDVDRLLDEDRKFLSQLTRTGDGVIVGDLD